MKIPASALIRGDNRLGLVVAATVFIAGCDWLKGKRNQVPPIEPPNCNEDGYCKILKGPFNGGKIEFKRTPVTNADWADVAKGLGEDRYVLLKHNSATGETRIVRKGKTAEELLPENFRAEAAGIEFEQGWVMTHGSLVLLKMVDNPSDIFDDDGEGRTFSGLLQPVVGVTYFHAVTWTLLKSQEEGGRYKYDLPTDDQHQYVASNAGTCEYGTEACTDIFKGDKKLAHMDEWNDGRGTTVAVNDLKYDEQTLPFGVHTTGNVLRWMRFNPAETWAYGLFGGSWRDDPYYGRVDVRRTDYYPYLRLDFVGFSVVREDLK